jgi:hypothetical protein
MGILEQVLAGLDASRRTVGRNVSDLITVPGKEMGMDADYLAHLVSIAGQPGTGKQALKTMQLQGPSEFISTPQSQGFYQKLLREGLQGLQEHPDPEFGHTRYMLKGTK